MFMANLRFDGSIGAMLRRAIADSLRAGREA
jgi:hypothetical protein